MTGRLVSSRTVFALFFLIFIWGCSYPIYKIAIPYTPPLLFAGMRATIGGILLAGFLLTKRRNINWIKNWPKYCISALFNTVFFFSLQTVALVYLSSGMISLLVYFQPVLLALFAWLWLGEHMSLSKIIGLVVGFIGVVIASMEWFIDRISVIGVILGLLTAVVWALGVSYVKKVSREVDAFWMVALQCLIGGFILVGVGSLFESWSGILWTPKYLAGLGYGSTFGIPIAYIIYYSLVNGGDAGKVGVFTFLVPIVSVFIGTVFLGEPITYSLLTGLLLVVISIYFVNYSNRKKVRMKKKHVEDPL